jgi:hypothetical protein
MAISRGFQKKIEYLNKKSGKKLLLILKKA